MASFSAIRDGLKTRLATISGLNTFDTIPAGAITPSAIVGGPSGKEFQVNYVVNGGPGGVTEWILPILVYAGAPDITRQQDLMDAYLDSSGSTSIKAAIEGDKTLGGIAQTTRVTKVEDYDHAEGWMIFRVEVLTRG